MIAALTELWAPILTGVAVAVVVGVLGGVATDIGPWYRELRKPRWQPPDWAFGPVWTTIFILAVAAGTIAWRDAPDDAARRMILLLFALNAVLNIVWSFLFFTFRRPDWAMIEVLFLWLSILALIVAFWPFAPLASLLLAPYLLWVSIASVLNLTIIRLNGPFRKAA